VAYKIRALAITFSKNFDQCGPVLICGRDSHQMFTYTYLRNLRLSAWRWPLLKTENEGGLFLFTGYQIRDYKAPLQFIEIKANIVNYISYDRNVVSACQSGFF